MLQIAFLDSIKWDYDAATPLERPLGGSQSALCYLAAALTRRGHRVRLFNGIAAAREALGVVCRPVAELAAAALHGCDVVVSLNGPADQGPVLRPHLPPSVPLVLWTQHAPDQPAMHPLDVPANREAWDVIVCVSHWHRGAMIRRYGLDPARVTVLGNALTPAFEHLPTRPDELARAKGTRPVLAYTSTPFRGLDVLLDAFPEVRRRHSDAELRVYSSMQVYQADAASDAYRPLYERCRATPGVSYVGSLPQPRLAKALREAAVLAYPSTFAETFCIAALEALAAGMAVVTTDLGALPETTQGYAALVKAMSGPGDRAPFVARYAAALAETLDALAADPAGFWARRAEQARAVQASHTWAARARQWEEAIAAWRGARGGGRAARPDDGGGENRGPGAEYRPTGVASRGPAAPRPAQAAPRAPQPVVPVPTAPAAPAPAGAPAVVATPVPEPKPLPAVVAALQAPAAPAPAAPPVPAVPPAPQPAMRAEASSRFAEWLGSQRAGLAFTCPGAGKVVMLGVDAAGKLALRDRDFPGCGALAATARQVWVGTDWQLWRLEDVLASGQLHEGHDRLYVPRVGYVVGDLEVSDLALDADGQPLFVTNRAGCLAALDPVHSYRTVWRPPGQWRPTGVALHPGQPRLVTALDSDGNGAILDAADGALAASGLVLPLAPRWHNGALWVLDAGTGLLGVLDRGAARVEPRAFCPGLARGLALLGNYAVVTLARPEDDEIKNLPLADELTRRGAEPWDGLLVIDLATGKLAQRLRLAGLPGGAGAVAVLPGVRQPALLGLEPHEARVVTVGAPPGAAAPVPGAAAAAAPAVARDPTAEEDARKGQELHQQGKLAEAVVHYKRALARHPDWAEVENNLGAVYQAQEQHDEAAAAYERALAVRPDFPEALNNLGNIRKLQGKLDEAERAYWRALALKPDFAEAEMNLGGVLRSLGRLKDAAEAYRRALAVRPDYGRAALRLADTLRALGQSAEAAERLEEAATVLLALIERKPNYADAYYHLGIVRQSQGQLDKAAAAYEKAIQLKPDHAEAVNNLGTILVAKEQSDKAEQAYRRALEIKPQYADAESNLGAVLQGRGLLGEAEAACRRAVELRPRHAVAWNNLSNILLVQGRVDEARAGFQRALELRPDYSNAHSNVLMCEQYQPGATAAALAVVHAEWDRRHAAPLRPKELPRPTPADGRPLRVGLVSADLARHPVGYFLVRILESFDRSKVEIICYSGRRREDDISQRMKAASTLWRFVADAKDDELANQVRADRIDILIDLSGHTNGHRLLVFARKPAPVQMTWAGYVGTTGISTIDYLIADRHEVPDGEDAHYCEKVLRLPDGYVSYDPPAYAPAVGPLPAAANGHVTFACFNNPAKLNREVIAVFSEVLRSVPGSRLHLQYRGLDDKPTAERFRELFRRHGVDPGRVELRGWSSHPDLFAAYNKVDIALDPFPYSGGLTTIEALYMGVPVVTFPGQTFAGRHSVSHLSVVGVTETIAKDLADYVAVAARLADDLPHLAELRAGLRQRVLESPLCDGPRMARNLERALRAAYEECARQSALANAG